MKASILSILFCLLAAGIVSAQTATNPPAGDGPTNSLMVQISPQLSRGVFHAPATIRINAIVTQRSPSSAGDFVEVEFFANTNRLGSTRSASHGVVRPRPRPGQPVPLFVIAPGFAPAGFVWTNVPAGHYALTARATGDGGLSAVSPPVNITVLP